VLSAQAAGLQVAVVDGRVLDTMALSGDPAAGYELTVAGRRQRLRQAEVLAVHGVAMQAIDLAAVWLEGDEVVRGALVGGDEAGDTVTVLSPVLGSVQVSIDRVAAFVSNGHGVLTPGHLPLPEGVDEALFTSARIGYDLTAGSLHRFTAKGVRFAGEGADTPESYRLEQFVALRIGDPEPRLAPLPALLLTRTGDRVGVRVRSFSATGVSCELESGRVAEIRHADLACLTFLEAGTFLSDLQPADVVESGFDGAVLHPYRRDHAVLGGALVAAERSYAKGFGVHSRSRLSFVVPVGIETFWTRVGLDDSATALPFRAAADVRVLRDGEVAFEHIGLEAGLPPQNSGLIKVKPGQTLILEVDYGRGRDLGDRVDWLTPVFLPAPRR